MKFEITDGLNKVSIGLSEIGNYLYFKKPLIISWYDCHGSVGKYLCLLPYNEDYRNEVKNHIHANLNADFTGRIEELITVINPLFQLFPNGEYELDFYHSSNESYFQYTSSRDNYETVYEYQWNLLFSEPMEVNDKQKINEYKVLVGEAEDRGQYTQYIMPATDNFYEAYDEKLFIATQPKSIISEERVKYFEEQIKSGLRPFAIVFNSYYKDIITNTDNSVSHHILDSDCYVLDGHHKLIAYHNLNIKPSFAIVTHLPRTREEIVFNIEELIEVMYPWQIEHMIENWYDGEEYLAELAKNPDSKIHQFYKNGYHQKFYQNGQIKREAFYVNNKIHGISMAWYNDGQLEHIQSYENGSLIKGETWYQSGAQRSKSTKDSGESYYENGQLQSKGEWIENNTIRLSQTWYENGQLQSESKSNSARSISDKYYSNSGQLLHFNEFDPVANKMVSRL